MSITDLGSNIERIRKELGIKVKDLCKKVEISDTSYRNIRKGVHEPHSRTIKAIAKVLNVSVFELLKETPSLNSLRFRSSITTEREELQQKQIIFEVARKLRHCNELIELLGDKPIESPVIKLREFYKSNNDIETLAEEAREKFDLEDEPIIDICSLFENKGIMIFPVPSRLNFFGACLSEEDGGPAICVNNRENITTEKQIFTCAHELGHLIMHSAEGELTKEEIKAEEKEANKFAGYFLAPSKEVKKKLKEASGLHLVDAILHVKSHFNMSCLAMLHRVAEIIELDHNELRELFISHYEKKFDKKWDNCKEPEGIPDTRFEEDSLPLLVKRAFEDEKISISKAAEILQIPLVDMRNRANLWTFLSGKFFN